MFTFQFLDDEIDQNINFAKFLSLSQFSLVTGFFEGMRENILHIFWALAPVVYFADLF